ncbi:unnamed protein product [Clonostachys rosea f. rosea IK726]|uniref:Thioredoxin n=3 Tax=Clonostachys TaxID=110564 RepID=A0A0B7KAQ9_BIOOC|nr:unnamed protein product [Clonostachys rosea f. rosea IK726]CAH0025235.1 unnamed protein product [Clonostachys rhizophaga]
MGVHNIKTKEDFEQTLHKHRAVAVDFYATWYTPCKTIAPAFVECSEQDRFKDVRFLKVDIDQLPELAADMGVREMPAFKLFLDDKPAGDLVGADKDGLIRLLEKAV